MASASTESEDQLNLQQDETNCSHGEASKEDCGVPRSATRSIYLVTYSQASLEKFPHRNDFAKAIIASFTQGSARVLHWCCSLESHSDGGKHYHMALKLNKIQRWLPSKRYLLQQFGVSVHYSNIHHDYYSAWRYVTKSDEGYKESDGHPDLANADMPKTSKASIRKKNLKGKPVAGSQTQGKRKAKRIGTAKKKRRLRPLDVSNIILKKNIKTETELYALAQEQREQGKTDLAQFILNRSPKSLADILSTTWEMKKAGEKIRRQKKSRMDLLQEVSKSDCVPGCNGDWLQCANEVLQNNGIDISCFAESVRESLTKGRKKNHNVMIVGPANCGKTFLLKPLRVLYRTFCNPATGSFAWVGIEDAECIFLNDFRWSPQVIPWHDLLLMLEGEVVHLPAPKTHFTQDIEFQKDTPIFCTSKRPLIFIKNGIVDDRETDMMAVRWKVFYLNYPIPLGQQRQDLLPCPKCFAALVLQV